MPVVEVVQVVVMRDRAVTAAITVDVVVFGQVVLPMRRVIHEPIHLPSGGAARRIREGNGQPASPANTGHRRYRRQRCPIQHDPVAVRVCSLRSMRWPWQCVVGGPATDGTVGWSGGVALRRVMREAMVMLSPIRLVGLIADAGLATDAPDEGSGPIRSRPGPVQRMSGSRVRCSPTLGAVVVELSPCSVVGRGKWFWPTLRDAGRGCDLGARWPAIRASRSLQTHGTARRGHGLEHTSTATATTLRIRAVSGQACSGEAVSVCGAGRVWRVRTSRPSVA